MISATAIGAIVTGICTILAAVVGGLVAWRTKRTREPLSWETMLTRLAAVEARADGLQTQVDALRAARTEQDEKIRLLNGDVTTYRQAFRALWLWADRLRRDWTGTSPVPGFTFEEQQAVDAATAERRHRQSDDPWNRSALPPTATT